MESFTIELVSNASAKIYPDNALNSFTKFVTEQLNLDGQWEGAFSEKSYQSMYQNVSAGKFKFFDTKLSNSSDYYYLEPSLFHSITDIVEATNMLFQERHNHTDTSIALKVFRRSQKVGIHPANEGSDLALFSTDIFGNNDGNASAVMLRGKVPHKQVFAYDLDPKHSLMIYTDSIEYNFVGEQRLHCCSAFPLFPSWNLGTL